MPINNSEIAEQLEEIANLLEIDGANSFRVRAYRNAARTIWDYPGSISQMVDKGRPIPKLSGIGADLADKIQNIARGEELPILNEMRQKVTPGLAMLLTIPGLGPKRVRALRDLLGIHDAKELIRAASEGRIRRLRGFSEKMEKKILEGSKEALQKSTMPRRLLLPEAEHLLIPLLEYLKKAPGLIELAPAGSFRRHAETIGDLDILVSCKRGKEMALIDWFTKYDRVERVTAQGETRAAVRLFGGINADLRVLPADTFGAGLHYFTGSKAHNIAIRMLGVRRGLKINEYGVHKGRKRIGGRTEAEVYAAVGLNYIEPELRETRGEIEASAKNELPTLINMEDLRGDLHSHTDETDGRSTMEEMAAAAQERGYEYLAITDHSQRLTVTKGMDSKRLTQQLRKIDRLNSKLRSLTLLKAIEVDILEDGTLDLPDTILRELDLRVCSIHYKFNLPRDVQTKRVLRAMDNKYFNILAHPTGRLLGKRPPYDIDIEAILKKAKKVGCFVELNSQPDRLDLADTYCLAAKHLGLKLAVSTDAHSVLELDNIRYGVWQARRGWLEAENVLNTKKLTDLLKLFKR